MFENNEVVMDINLVHMPICCDRLRHYVSSDGFRYYPQYRGICLYYKKDNCYPHLEGEEFGEYFLYYCPFCGKEMPKILYGGEMYGEALGKATGTPFNQIDLDEVPEEFKTDEWWIKRGL